MTTESTTAAELNENLSFLDDIPDADLEAIWEAVQDGANTYGEVVGIDDASLNTIEDIAISYYRSRRYEEAAVIYGFILQVNPNRPTAWRGLGACAHAQKGYDIALRCYQAAFHWNPADVISKVYAGECLCMLGDKAAGLKLLQAVIEQGSEDMAELPYITRARAIVGADGGVPARVVLVKEGDKLIGETEEVLREMGVEFDPDAEINLEDMMRNPKLRQGFADVKEALREGRLTYADVGGFTDFELDGTYAVACNYANIGQGLQAIQICGYLMLIDPYKGRYYQLVGICLQRMKQYDLADHYYRIALSLDSDDPMTLIYQGEVKIMQGKIDEGVGIISKGVELAASNSELHDVKSRGEILIQQFGS